MEKNKEENRKKVKTDNETPHALGKSGEEAAIRYLEKKNYRIIGKSFRSFRGEIDIVAYHGKTLVFVEVKTRKSKDFGFPEESVTPSKQRQIRKIAQAYLAKNKLKEVECRFDVLSIFYTPKDGYAVHHIQNAF